MPPLASVIPWEQVCRMLEKVQGEVRMKKKEMLLKFISHFRELHQKKLQREPNCVSVFVFVCLLLYNWFDMYYILSCIFFLVLLYFLFFPALFYSFFPFFPLFRLLFVFSRFLYLFSPHLLPFFFYFFPITTNLRKSLLFFLFLLYKLTLFFFPITG